MFLDRLLGLLKALVQLRSRFLGVVISGRELAGRRIPRRDSQSWSPSPSFFQSGFPDPERLGISTERCPIPIIPWSLSEDPIGGESQVLPAVLATVHAKYLVPGEFLAIAAELRQLFLPLGRSRSRRAICKAASRAS